MTLTQLDNVYQHIEKSLLYCVICLECFNRPRTLSCQHSFCQECLRKYWMSSKKRKKSSLVCPTCRAETSLDRSSINCVPFNDLLEDLGKMLVTIKVQSFEERDHTSYRSVESCNLCEGNIGQQGKPAKYKLCAACITETPNLYRYSRNQLRNGVRPKYSRLSITSLQKLSNAYRLAYWIRHSHRFVADNFTKSFTRCAEADTPIASTFVTAVEKPKRISTKSKKFYVGGAKGPGLCKGIYFCLRCSGFVCSFCETSHEKHATKIPLISDISRCIDLFKEEIDLKNFTSFVYRKSTWRSYVLTQSDEIEKILRTHYLGSENIADRIMCRPNSNSTDSSVDHSLFTRERQSNIIKISERSTSFSSNQNGRNALTDQTHCKYKSFKTLLTCKLCNKEFNDPRVLRCQHSFCKLCLQGLLTRNELRCPVCGIKTKSSTGIDDLPKNNILMELKYILVSSLLNSSDKMMDMHVSKLDNPCNCCELLSDHCLDVCNECFNEALQCVKGTFVDRVIVPQKVFNKIHEDLDNICESSLIYLSRNSFTRCLVCRRWKDIAKLGLERICEKCSFMNCMQNEQNFENHNNNNKGLTSVSSSKDDVRDKDGVQFTNYVAEVSEISDKVCVYKRTTVVVKFFSRLKKKLKDSMMKYLPEIIHFKSTPGLSIEELILIDEIDCIRRGRGDQLSANLRLHSELTFSEMLVSFFFLVVIVTIYGLAMASSKYSL